MKFILVRNFILIYILFLTVSSFAQDRYFVTKNRFAAPEARQGIAVDENYIYVIGTQEIAKYDKVNYKLIKKWVGDKNGSIRHLDSGVIVDGKLYSAHSNYPMFPMTSSVEIWDAETLEHIGTHSFGIRWGSCTWVDYMNGFWYAGFAHYKKWKNITGTDTKWTTVVKFDKNWIETEAWVFPNDIVEKFGNMSNSGGSFGPDGLLYLTGHDAPEIYVMKFPEAGSELELVEILPIENTGQGIAWDRYDPNFIYSIKKKDRQVVISELIYDK